MTEFGKEKVTVAEMRERVKRSQRRAKQYLKPGTSLAEELLAERRIAAAEENKEPKSRHK